MKGGAGLHYGPLETVAGETWTGPETLWLLEEGQGRAGALAGFMSASGVGSVDSRAQGLLLTI